MMIIFDIIYCIEQTGRKIKCHQIHMSRFADNQVIMKWQFINVQIFLTWTEIV